MPTKSQRRAKKRNQPHPDVSVRNEAQLDAQYKPKSGPGQTFTRQVVADIEKGPTAIIRRYRNVGASPLMLAHHRDQLACDAEKAWRHDKLHNRPPSILGADRLESGERFEKWWYERMCSPSRDSTVQSVRGGSSNRSITEMQERAARQIAFVREKMASRNYMIVEAFCGNGYTMKEAVRMAGIETNRDGTAYRVREALDDLVCVLTGRQQVPILVAS